MVAPRPSFEPAIRALEKYHASRSSTLSAEGQGGLVEVDRRLRRLDRQAGHLTDLNNALFASDEMSVEFDPDADTVTFRSGEMAQTVKLRRADPNKPLQMRTLYAGGAYVADSKGAAAQAGPLNLELEAQLEDFYHNAHRLLKLVRRLPGLGNCRCKQVDTVRNKLVEHPVGGLVYSFGYGSGGPVVRPIHRGKRQWVDKGLVSNSKALVTSLTKALERATVPHT